MKSIIIKSILWVGVFALAYFGLYDNITNEIKVREVMDARKIENIQKLKDLREVQLQYKKDKGYYADNGDTLLRYLFHANSTFINSDRADNDSIPIDMKQWKKIQNDFIRSIRKEINPSALAKTFYKKSGGKWKTLTEKEKVNRGYIDVKIYIAHELAFNNDYQSSRKGTYNIDTKSLSNITDIYNKQNSYQSFKSDFINYDNSVLENIKTESAYLEVKSNYSHIFDGDSSTKISLESLESLIQSNSNIISSIEKTIQENKDKKENAKVIIQSVEKQRSTYTETIGQEKIEKIREKAKKKAEKGKQLKGRQKIVYSIISKQDSTESANKLIVKNCENSIEQLKNEINAREMLVKVIDRNIQCLLDINTMQNQFANQNPTESVDFNQLSSYILNDSIKIITTLKKASYTIPTLPQEWKKAKLQAELVVEESLGEEVISKIDKRYQESGGKWRSLTEEEGFARGLITTIIKPVEEVIFDKAYLKDREKPNLDSLIYIPHTTKKYKFAAKSIHPNIMQQSQGEIDKYYFEISSSYDDIFLGLDEENIVLRENGENGDMKVGSLEKTITNGNWGE